jgi:5'-nucleotidase
VRRTRLSLAALAVASSAVLGLPTVAWAAPAAPGTTSTEAPDAAAPTTAEDPADAGGQPAEVVPAEPDPADEASTDAAPTAGAPTDEPPVDAVPAGAGVPVAGSPDTAEVAPLAVAEPPVAAAAPGDVVQLIAMNDFHGRISPQAGGDGTLITGPGVDTVYGTADDVSETVGGAANIATTLTDLRTAFPGPDESSFFVGAGDLVSASPFNSSVFKDEPTIEVLNALGLDYSSVGNHEFDRGITELKRISTATDGYEAAHGGAVTACQGVTAEETGCFNDSTGTAFAGAQFPYLAANVVDQATQEPVLPPYEVVTDAAGNRVGLIGVVTDDTPNIVSPTGIAGLTFGDEADAINLYAGQLHDQGIEAIAVMIHEGGTQAAGNGLTTCGLSPDSPIIAINDEVSPEVDAIISAHTHVPYDCTLPVPGVNGVERLVTQAGFYGKALTDIRLTFGADGDIDWAQSSATNVPVRRTAPDAAVQQIVGYWEARAAAEGSVPVGTQTADLDRAYRAGTAVRDAESGLGNLVADAQLAYARATPSLGGTDVDVAFMNPGGLRADINCLSSGTGDPDGNVTYAETFSVQPFSNTVNTVDLTGAGIEQVLEQQWATRSGSNAMLHLSVAGLTYEFDARRAVGDRVDPASVLVGGEPLSLTATYTVAANSFLIAGGDSFTAFTAHRPSGAVAVTGGNDVDAFNEYVLANSPVSPPALDRAVSLDPANTWDDDGSGAGPCAPGTSTPPVEPPPVQPPPADDGPIVPSTGGLHGVVGSGSGRGGSLAYTGAPVASTLALGGALTVAGAVLTAAGYRRRRGLAE